MHSIKVEKMKSRRKMQSNEVQKFDKGNNEIFKIEAIEKMKEKRLLKHYRIELDNKVRLGDSV